MQVTVELNGVDVPKKDHVKYLGVTLQSKMKFNLHVNNVINKAKMVKSSLWCIISPKSKLNVVNKMNVYKLYIRSVLTYNIQIWCDVSNTCMKRLQTYQNKSIRLILKLRPNPVTHRQISNLDIHKMTNMPTIMNFANRLKERYMNKCRNHPNEIVASFFPHTN